MSGNIVFAIVLFLVLVLGVVFLVLYTGNSTQPIEVTPTISIASTSPSTDNQGSVSPAPTIPKGYKEYRNEEYHFSLHYPGDIPVKEYKEDGAAMTITFQPENGEPGFQVFVQHYSGTQVTQERFLLDEPSGVMKDPIDFTFAGGLKISSGAKGVAGPAQNNELTWVIGGFLYRGTEKLDRLPVDGVAPLGSIDRNSFDPVFQTD